MQADEQWFEIGDIVSTEEDGRWVRVTGVHRPEGGGAAEDEVTGISYGVPRIHFRAKAFELVLIRPNPDSPRLI